LSKLGNLLESVIFVVVYVVNKCYSVVLIIIKMGPGSFRKVGVGRGVLRFGACRYRKPRSNSGGFGDFVAYSGELGVDIIYDMGGGQS